MTVEQLTLRQGIEQARDERYAQLSLLATITGYLEAAGAPRKILRTLRREARRLRDLNEAYFWAWGCVPGNEPTGEAG